MAQKVAVRSGKDRLRYTVVFEVFLMAMLVPAGAFFFDRGFLDIGALGVILALKAMIVNIIYNWCFDHVDARYGRVSSNRSYLGRLLHALGFEVTLTITSLPIYAYWLGVTWMEALAMDIFVTSFVVAFTYVYTLAYDRIYPVASPVVA